MKNLWRNFRALSWKQQAVGWVAAFILLSIVGNMGDAEAAKVAEELEAEVVSVTTTTLSAPDTTAAPVVQQPTTTMPVTATTTAEEVDDAIGPDGLRSVEWYEATYGTKLDGWKRNCDGWRLEQEKLRSGKVVVADGYLVVDPLGTATSDEEWIASEEHDEWMAIQELVEQAEC